MDYKSFIIILRKVFYLNRLSFITNCSFENILNKRTAGNVPSLQKLCNTSAAKISWSQRDISLYRFWQSVHACNTQENMLWNTCHHRSMSPQRWSSLPFMLNDCGKNGSKCFLSVWLKPPLHTVTVWAKSHINIFEFEPNYSKFHDFGWNLH